MRASILCLSILCVIPAGCGGPPASTPPAAVAAVDDHAGHDHGGGIALPDTVQRNLGITWATAGYRVVQGVLRMPGRFEAEPTARRSYQAPLPGRAEVLVRPYQRVAAGDPLYRLHAPEWTRLRRELADATASVHAAEDELASAVQHATAIDQAIELWSERLATLDRVGQDLGGKAAERVDAAARLVELRIAAATAGKARAEARRQARGVGDAPGTGQARLRLELLLGQASQLSGVPVADLEAPVGGRPRWAGMEAIEVRCIGAGVVEGDVVPDGTWIDDRHAVLTVTDPRGVRLRAAGLQSDLPRLADGMQARIIAADPAVDAAIAASVVIGPVADATDRSVEIIARPIDGAGLPGWVRPGVTAALEVVVSGSPVEELAIPVAATIRDGLATVFYRRDPRDAARVARVEADLGASDGRWVVVQSGLKEGDQVVLGGIYPLQLSQQTGGAQAGHFEADGTFHTGSH